MFYYIYGLFDPRNGELRYIGQTIQEKYHNRLNAHLASLKSGYYVSNWLKSVIKDGFRPEIYIIQQLYNKDDLNKAEVYWIKYFKDQGCKLTNLTSGGDGIFGFKHSEYSKIKMSNSKRGRSWTEAQLKSRLLNRQYSF